MRCQQRPTGLCRWQSTSRFSMTWKRGHLGKSASLLAPVRMFRKRLLELGVKRKGPASLSKAAGPLGSSGRCRVSGFKHYEPTHSPDWLLVATAAQRAALAARTAATIAATTRVAATIDAGAGRTATVTAFGRRGRAEQRRDREAKRRQTRNCNCLHETGSNSSTCGKTKRLNRTCSIPPDTQNCLSKVASGQRDNPLPVAELRFGPRGPLRQPIDQRAGRGSRLQPPLGRPGRRHTGR